MTPGAKDHGSDGIFQWRLDRLTNMQAFGVKNFGAWESIEAQAAFFSYECKGWYKPLWVDLAAGTKSLATLTANIWSNTRSRLLNTPILMLASNTPPNFMRIWKPELHQDDLNAPPVIPSVVPPVAPPVCSAIRRRNNDDAGSGCRCPRTRERHS